MVRVGYLAWTARTGGPLSLPLPSREYNAYAYSTRSRTGRVNPEQTIRTTFYTMMALQTIGSIDMKHRLPAPRQYVAIIVLWVTFFLLAGTRLARSAAQLSVLALLTVLVIGPFGARLISFFEMIAKRFAIPTIDPKSAAGVLAGIDPTTGKRRRGASFTPGPTQPGTSTAADTAPGAAPINI